MTCIKKPISDRFHPLILTLSLSLHLKKIVVLLFIARKINTPPAVAGKALNTCVTHGFISRFPEDLNTSRNNDLYQKTDTRPIPPSNSNSQSKSSSQEDSSTSVQRASSASRDGEVFWQAIDDLDIPF